MNTSTHFLRRVGTIAMLGVMLTSCGTPQRNDTATGNPTTVPTNNVTTPTTVVVQPTRTADSGNTQPTPTPVDAKPQQAILGFEPQVGGPGTELSIWGTGYTPNAPVVVRLGFPKPLGEVLTSAVADADGRWNATLVIPERLPSGDRITQAFKLVAMNDQNQPLASAPFNFIVGAEPPTEPAPNITLKGAEQAVRNLLTAWSTGSDVKPYLASNLRNQLDAGRPADQILGLHPIEMGDFSVATAETRASEVLFVPATINYGTFIEERTFTLVVENGEWRINGGSLDSSTQVVSTIKYLWPTFVPIGLSVQPEPSRASDSDWLLWLTQPHAQQPDVVISGNLIGEAPGQKVSDVTVRGLSGVTYTFDGGNAIVWQENNNNYGISGDRTVQELLEIANGLQEVERATWEQRASPQ